MKLEELIGSLRTFEMNLQEGKKEKKNIGITFQADTVEATDFEESMVLLSKNLNEAVKRFRKKNRNNIGGSVASAQNKGVQCRECEGYGHIQAECANTAKKKGKSFNAMWSDEDSDGSREEDGGTGNHLAFTTKFSTEVKTVTNAKCSNKETMTEEANIEACRLVLEKYEEVARVNQNLKHQVEFLQNKNIGLESTVSLLQEELTTCKGSEVSAKSELEYMKKSIKMLNTGTDKLDHILTIGKPSGEHHGLGFTGKNLSSKTVFVKEGSGAVPQQKIKTFTATIENPVKNSAGIAVKNHRRMNVPICHYCGRKGHIRLRCFQYLSDIRKRVARTATGKSRTQQMWGKKDDAQCYVTYNALKATPDHSWNCNSRFSRTGRALGKGTLDVTGLLKKKKIEE